MEARIAGWPPDQDEATPAAAAAGHFHDASHHGLAWKSINELLHVIVFVFSLFGMIQFEVKFISAPALVKWASRAIIAFNFYLSFKFALLACTMFLYNHKLEAQAIEISALNCSLASYTRFLAPERASQSNFELTSSSSSARGAGPVPPPPVARGPTWSILGQWNLMEPLVQSVFGSQLLPWLTWLVDNYGGPYKLLGNRATFMYGVYSIALFIMLALFPYELITEVEVGFNFIRFVLSDPKCMRDLYENRTKHLARLANWSRTRSDSLLTQGAKMILSQRDLRTNYTRYCEPELGPERASRALTPLLADCALDDELGADEEAEDWAETDDERDGRDDESGPGARPVSASRRLFAPAVALVEKLQLRRRRVAPFGQRAGISSAAAAAAASTTITTTTTTKQVDDDRDATGSSGNRPGGYILAAPLRQLTPHARLGHEERPSARVAQRNLRHFKPFVRSDVWFKASMVIYPCFIVFYFLMLTAFIGIIQLHVDGELRNLVEQCAKLASGVNGSNKANATDTAATNRIGAANWSKLDWLLYYENYYLLIVSSCGTGFYCSYYFGTIVELAVWLREISQQLALSANAIEITDVLANHTRAPVSSAEIRRILSSAQPVGLRRDIGQLANEFGGFRQLFADLRGWWSDGARAPCKTKLRELMAARLLDKKETLMRATYVNMCLFLDELNETRFMTTTILARTTLMCAGFALMCSITRSQFKANYGNLYYLLGTTFLIFNVYMACGAYINSRVNEMLVQIHSLISTSLRAGSEDADLLEFWLRHVNSFGQDKNTAAYEIYGYKITWSAVLNIDSVILSLYFMTA